ncbi:hypothetical protein ACVWZZ_001467 [Bradyrhizobium sp. LM6.10]
MTNSSVRWFELASSLRRTLRTLSQLSDARSCLNSFAILGSNLLLALRFGVVDEARLRPVLIPIRRRRH